MGKEPEENKLVCKWVIFVEKSFQSRPSLQEDKPLQALVGTRGGAETI